MKFSENSVEFIQSEEDDFAKSNRLKTDFDKNRRNKTPRKRSKMAKKLSSPLSFLPLYNLFSAVGWSYLLYLVIFLYPKIGQPSFFYHTKNIATLIQCGATIEIVNSLLGIVRSPLLTTVAQVSSRLLVVLGIFQLLPNTSGVQSIVYITLLLAWSITEIVRYLYYFFTLVFENGAPKILILLRYNLFWVLYPTGVASELRIIYCALNVAEAQYSLLYKKILVAAMLAYIPGFPMLFLHMVTQRRKVMKSLKSAFGKKLIWMLKRNFVCSMSINKLVPLYRNCFDVLVIIDITSRCMGLMFSKIAKSGQFNQFLKRSEYNSELPWQETETPFL